MSFLLDTNAVSEPGRAEPNQAFMAWYEPLPEGEIFLSAIALGEVRRGVSRLDHGPRRRALEALYANILRHFGAQILSVDAPVAEVWGDLSARLKGEGRVIGIADELIAATALTHGLTLVTRNQRHFEATGCALISPWSMG